MDHRQRGVAHVSIFWALVPMVLMFGAFGYGYLKHTEADQAMKTRDEIVAKQRLVDDRLSERERQLKELTAMLENAGEFKPNVPLDDYTAPTQFSTPDKVTDALKVFSTTHGMPTSLTKLGDVLGEATKVIKGKTDQIAVLQKSLTEARAERDDARNSLAAREAELNTQIQERETRISNGQRTLDQTVTQNQTELAGEREKVSKARQERDDVAKDASTKIAAKDKEMMDLHAALQRRKDMTKVINSPDEPDGRVLEASAATRQAWIDIGAKDLVKTGLTFEFMERVDGGWRVKGKGVVTKVEHDRSQMDVEGLTNDYNPIVRGDTVANRLYTPGLRRNIYLLGRFVTPLSKPEIKKILETMGNTVSDVMDPSVDLVILGRKDIGEEAKELVETDEAKMASNWDVEMVPLNKVRDFLKL
jgi:hypothetical protein